jgi:hypothetical protein
LFIEPKEIVATEDQTKIWLYIGMIIVMIPIITALILINPPAGFNPSVDPDFDNWANIQFIFRLFLFVQLILLGTASCIQILHTYKINYLYIFEVSPKNAMTWVQIYKSALLMQVIWCVCLLA